MGAIELTPPLKLIQRTCLTLALSIVGLSSTSPSFGNSALKASPSEETHRDVSPTQASSLRPSGVVINEIQFKPEEEGTAGEFIELYNPSDESINVSGWRLEDAITYTIPEGTEIPAGGYLVLAEHPPTILNEYGVTASGPWTGGLSSKGERIDLRDASGTLIDRVSYGVGFPWPSATDGGGSSIERLNHLLDSPLAGTWRASGHPLGSTLGTRTPTPGAQNSVAAEINQIPPHIEQVSHIPKMPKSGQSVMVSARVTDTDGVGQVSLSYQLVEPGSYVRLTDPAYQTQWITVPMLAGADHVWTATLPSNLQKHRSLVRYRIHVEDSVGNTQTIPYSDDQSPNFAYFVNDGIPDWSGAFRPGETPIQTFPASVLESIPVYTLIANDSDVIDSQYNQEFHKVDFTGTFVYEGQVYDHIEFRNRGQQSTYVTGKNKWRFTFNRAQRLKAKDTEGKPYKETWRHLAANACASPWAPINRGATGVDESAAFRAFQLAGLPAPHTHYYHFRVIRSEQEAPETGVQVADSIGTADGQYAGDFWGLYLAIEPIRGNFLDERGLPEGNIYEIENHAGDKKEQAVGLPVDESDWNAFRDAHLHASPSEEWWRANMDMEAYYTYHAINRLTGNMDLREGNNHYFYHRSSDHRWVPIPWDVDMMFIAKPHHSINLGGQTVAGVINAHKSILEHPALALEFRNRGREILDLFASDASPEGGQAGQLIREVSAPIHTAEQPLSWAHADAAMWNVHPRTRGDDSHAVGQYNHRGNFFRSPYTDLRLSGVWVGWLRSPNFIGTAAPDDIFNRFRDYMTNTWPGGQWNADNGDQRGYGYQALLAEVLDPDIPETPSLNFTGEPSYPANKLTFEASVFSDPQGVQTFAARQWRISEINAPNAYEIQALWSTTTTALEATTTMIPSSVIIPGHQYRVRVRQQDNTGRWSHWSEPASFTASAEQSELVHYWNFNQNSTPQQLLTPTLGSGNLHVEPGPTLEIIAGTGQDFAAVNAREGDPAGSHLRINNPLGSTLTFHISTRRFSDITVRFETRRSGQGAGEQIWSYTVDGENWQIVNQVLPPDGVPALFELDFRSIPTAWNNPKFAVRVAFSQGSGGPAGNNRFDNFTVTGAPMEDSNFPPTVTNLIQERLDVIEGQSLTLGRLSEWFADPDGDELSFSLTTSLPDLVTASHNEDLIQITGRIRGEVLLTVTASDSLNESTEARVRVLIHPAPHLIASKDFTFTEWSPEEPELSYPANMLFLQSEGNDSTLSTRLDRAYSIPHEDYSPNDSAIIGKPYQASSRTRINGLSEEGISFINTGRGRDLGGALVALDTRGTHATHVSFTAGTVTPNFRPYALRLQYRIGTQGDFIDLQDSQGLPIEYTRQSSAGHSTEFADIELPSHLLGQPYIQLLWRYHQHGEGSGARDEIRLDDVHISAQTTTFSYHEWRMLHFNDPEALADNEISGPDAIHGMGEITHLQRYALGISLHETIAPPIAYITPDKVFRFRYNSEKTDLIWLVKTSADLINWDTLLFDSRTSPPPSKSEDGWADIPLSNSNEPRLFMRLELQLSPSSES